MNRSFSQADFGSRTAMLAIAVILVFAALKLGAEIFAPMTLGLVTGVILAPITQALERAGLPVSLSAVLVLVFGMLGLLFLAILLEPVIWRVMDELPRIRSELRAALQDLRGLLRGLDAVNREVKAALGTEAAGGEAATVPDMPGLTDALVLAPYVLAQTLVFGGTLFFFLLTRNSVYCWLAGWIGSSDDTIMLLRRFDAAERIVAQYFLTITIINVGLGILLGAALSLIGLPGPFVWGALAALLNFVVYLGPMALVMALVIAGLVAFNGLMALVPVAIYLTLNLLESQFVTPTLLGRHMSVNPLLIFVSLVVWLWVWGPIGGIVAIPVLVITMVMLDLFEEGVTDTGAEKALEEASSQAG